MSRTVYIVMRSVSGPCGGCTVPMKAFSDKGVAQKFATDRTAEASRLMGARMGLRGPDGVMDDAGMAVADFFQSFGLVNVGHFVAESDVAGADLFVPAGLTLVK